MRRFMCFGLHRWKRMKWGATCAPYPDLDCRECRRCGFFQIVAFGYWRSIPAGWSKADYEPTRPA